MKNRGHNSPASALGREFGVAKGRGSFKGNTGLEMHGRAFKALLGNRCLSSLQFPTTTLSVPTSPNERNQGMSVPGGYDVMSRQLYGDETYALCFEGVLGAGPSGGYSRNVDSTFNLRADEDGDEHGLVIQAIDFAVRPTSFDLGQSWRTDQ